MGFLKNLGKKLGMEHKEKVNCVKCRREISAHDKICPHCDAWNDCCSVDPRTLKNKK